MTMGMAADTAVVMARGKAMEVATGIVTVTGMHTAMVMGTGMGTDMEMGTEMGTEISTEMVAVPGMTAEVVMVMETAMVMVAATGIE